MPDLADLYPGFASHWIDTAAGRIFARSGGKGPPLLLLHGYPQTNVMWHRVAPALAAHFSLIIPDLPGYGWSDAPPSDATHAPYTKRAMAAAMIEAMEALGHARFRLAGHDRGGRVAYRLALDHPGRLEQLAVLDIVPTWAMWHRMDARLATRAWHWMFLALPAPFPETMIGKEARYFFRHPRRGWNQDQESLGLRSARARPLPRLLRRSGAHPRDLRGLSRRPAPPISPTTRKRARQARRSPVRCSRSGAPPAHPGRDRGSARDLARMGDQRARLCPRLRALSRRGGAGRDGEGAARVFHFGPVTVHSSRHQGGRRGPCGFDGIGRGCGNAQPDSEHSRSGPRTFSGRRRTANRRGGDCDRAGGSAISAAPWAHPAPLQARAHSARRCRTRWRHPTGRLPLGANGSSKRCRG